MKRDERAGEKRGILLFFAEGEGVRRPRRRRAGHAAQGRTAEGKGKDRWPSLIFPA